MSTTKPVYIETTSLGRISRTKLEKLIKANGGTAAGLSRAIGVNASTIRTWKHELKRRTLTK